jgi:hypothetical protein
MFQTGRMKTKDRWTSLNWVWHMTNRLLAMGVPPSAGGIVVTAGAPPDSSKRAKKYRKVLHLWSLGISIKPFNYD